MVVNSIVLIVWGVPLKFGRAESGRSMSKSWACEMQNVKLQQCRDEVAIGFSVQTCLSFMNTIFLQATVFYCFFRIAASTVSSWFCAQGSTYYIQPPGACVSNNSWKRKRFIPSTTKLMSDSCLQLGHSKALGPRACINHSAVGSGGLQ